MSQGDNFFSQHVKDISFITLKGQSSARLKSMGLNPELPLPVVTEKLLTELNASEAAKNISADQIIEGIIYVLGSDEKFPHNSEYTSILRSYVNEPDRFLFNRALEALNRDDLVFSGLILRTFNQMFESNNGKFYYALVLEGLAKKKIDGGDADEGNKLLEESTVILEEILENDQDFYPAYYKLGYHYKFYELYTKAKLTWDKALLLETDETRKEELRIELDAIELDYRLELANSYLDNMKYEFALDHLMKLLPKEKSNWYVNYLIGIAYRGYGDIDRAKEFLLIALECNNNAAEIYNELGITYFNEGDIMVAIKVFTDGINNCPDDFRLYFNRGLGKLNIGEVESSREDVAEAFRLNPNDLGVQNQLIAIDEYLKNN
jgi:tetratricopeptide (TPR) repeat protein